MWIEVNGKYTGAKIFTDDIEAGALAQVTEVCNHIAFKDSKVRIMPDVHQGKGICIGFTAEMTDKIIPNVVGVDIGCGMYTVELGDIEIDLEKLDKIINNEIPSGFEGYEYPQVALDNEQIEVIDRLGLDYLNHARKVGTLGGGNHFIEVNEDEDGNKYLVIHSGSRNFGYKIARHHQDKAKKQFDNKYKDKINDKIEELKSKGEHQKIEKTIQKMKKDIPDVNNDLLYLRGKLKDQYLHDMKVAQKYAEQSRKVIANKILHYLGIMDIKTAWQTTHNYIGADDIIRKGAISARKGETVLIPLNMKDGSLIAEGKGNADWNYSAPHGAGRIMSRTQAKKELDFDEFKESMEDIYTTSVKETTLDEAPGAYKDSEVITKAIGDTVEIIKRIKPIYNYKESRKF